MKKTTCAAWAACALLGAVPAMAQSSVQLYGRVNTALEYQQYGSHSVTGLTSNGSFLGIKGQEVLPSGYRAGFVLEGDVFSDNGAAGTQRQGLDWHRQSEVYLYAGWGTLRLGRFDTASYAMVGEPLNLLNDNAGAISDLNFRARNTGNTIAYRTPAMGGWTAEVQRSLGEGYDDGYEKDHGNWDAGVAYVQGPWNASVGYARDKWTSLTSDYRYVEQNVSAQLSYRTGPWLLGSYAQWSKFSEHGAGMDKASDARALLRLVGMYRVGASELHANLGRTQSVNGGDKNGVNHWTLGYHHNLSARSRVYALWGRTNAMTPQAYPTLWQYAGHAHSHHAVLLGVRHLF